MFDQLENRVQIIGEYKFIVVNSQTVKTKRTLFSRIFSRPFKKYNYEHYELIDDDKFYTGNINGQTYSYCNQRTFDKLKRESRRCDK